MGMFYFRALRRVLQVLLVCAVPLTAMGAIGNVAAAGTLSRVSVASDGTQGNNDSWAPSTVTPDGRYIAFVSQADNLVPNDTNGAADVFVRDRVSNVTERINVGSSGVEGNAGV